MNVTIATDASFSKILKRGTYAFWITSNEGVIRKAGILRSKVKHSVIAEMKCIINALHYLQRQEWFSNVKHVYVNTDCLNAIHHFKNDMDAIHQYKINHPENRHLAKVYTLLKKNQFKGVKIELRHIKAHERSDTPRHYTNDWCDREAKKQMSKLLNNDATTSRSTNNSTLYCRPCTAIQIRKANS